MKAQIKLYIINLLMALILFLQGTPTVSKDDILKDMQDDTDEHMCI